MTEIFINVSFLQPSLVTERNLMKSMKLAGLVKLNDPEEIDDLTEEMVAEIRSKLGLDEDDSFKVVSIKCHSPNFESGSSCPLSFKKKKMERTESDVGIWTLADIHTKEDSKQECLRGERFFNDLKGFIRLIFNFASVFSKDYDYSRDSSQYLKSNENEA